MLPSSTPTRKRARLGQTGWPLRGDSAARRSGRCVRASISGSFASRKKIRGSRCLSIATFCRRTGTLCTAAITGAWVAVADAVRHAKKSDLLAAQVNPLTAQVAAVSVGIVDKVPVLDLDYVEDVDAHVDMNVAMLADNTLSSWSVQGTGEHATFSEPAASADAGRWAQSGIRSLHRLQRAALPK